ncbi:MAG TPA: hypothetical protein VLQ45_33760 [Thermoanaerobaculia bacterium]|nr:hypothetical protein [Thermoanaerobaculia bacterium]
MYWWIVVMVLGQIAFACLIVWMFLSYRLKREDHRAQERDRLLNRFGTGPEMVEFLSSPGGQKLLDSFAVHRTNTVLSLARTIRAGVVLLSIGAAFMILAYWGPSIENLMIPGVLLGMAGSGILVSAAISNRMFRRAGLLTRVGDGGAA